MCSTDAGGGRCGSSIGGRRNMHAIVILFLVIALGTYAAKNIKQMRYIGKPDTGPHTIMVSGDGKVTATPNIAVTNVGLVTEKTNVADAQLENSQKMNALIVAMQQLGISKEDIRTAQYQIYPKYSYDQKTGSSITGYTVTQSVEVKIRDLTKISQVLASAGSAGANQVSGVQFTVEDPKVLRAEAREEAVADAKEKAVKLAAELGVELGKLISYSETTNNNAPYPQMMMRDLNVGASQEGTPNIQSGTLEITSEVSITYEIE